ncbi:MAG TPA: type VI secretion system-associated protein TagF [Vineibacter sp.]|nr:type VI secretion system-associated protein TagF [Vineibacter sp.]
MNALEAGGGTALAAPAGARVGFFGKLPGRGDFVRRDLPNAFVDTWDAWVQQGMEASRATLGDAWLDSWLCAPIWRFAIPNGICGPDGWAGVMMPSVDRAGRYFPLTLVAPAPAGVPSAAMLAGDWIAGLEGAALSALGEDTDFDRFGDVVTALPPFSPIRAEAWVGGWRARARQGDVTAPIVAIALAAAAQGSQCVFTTAGGGRVAPAAWVLPHLPPQRAFIGLIDDMEGTAVPAAAGAYAPGMAVPLAIGGATAAPVLPAVDTALGHAANLFGSDFATDVPTTIQGEPPGGVFDQLFDQLAPAAGEPPAAGAFDQPVASPPDAGGFDNAAAPDVPAVDAPVSDDSPITVRAPSGAFSETAPAEAVTAPGEPWPAQSDAAKLSPKDLFGDAGDDVPPAPTGLFDDKGSPT